LRSADNRARSAFVAPLLKSIFLPLAGWVFAEMDNGSPMSCTRATLVSVPPTATVPSVALLNVAGAVVACAGWEAVKIRAATAAIAAPAASGRGGLMNAPATGGRHVPQIGPGLAPT
jgi:hypothetical protein